MLQVFCSSPFSAVRISVSVSSCPSSQLFPETVKLLPIEKNESGLSETEYIFEPSKEAVTEGLYDLCLQADVYGLLLQVAEGAFGAMMVAMRQAADNSGDVLDALTLNLNRMRQAQITTQVIEVSSSLTGGNEI